jgi:ubiquinone/menaquinone biosynthesis C-methylase UbiE
VRTQDWHWNEFQQVGTDYADVQEVAKYDARMSTFRNVEAENSRTLELLGLPPGSRVLEIGCGTGRFARAAAAAGHQVTAVDVSPVMLEYVAQKAREESLSGIETRHAGFLSMDLPGDRFDGVVSTACLHHLPDLWKLVALENVCRALKPEGQFVLGDVVFSIGPGEAAREFEDFVSGLPEAIRPGAAQHVAKEYSTLDWIMAGLLDRAGFEVLSAERARASFIVYHCRKAGPGSQHEGG